MKLQINTRTNIVQGLVVLQPKYGSTSTKVRVLLPNMANSTLITKLIQYIEA